MMHLELAMVTSEVSSLNLIGTIESTESTN